MNIWGFDKELLFRARKTGHMILVKEFGAHTPPDDGDDAYDDDNNDDDDRLLTLNRDCKAH